jgi:hypothetical protein
MKKVVVLIILFSCKVTIYAQSCHNVKELYRKRHTISGMTYGHPYTTFDRHNNLSFTQTINNIRSILSKKDENDPVFNAYQKIYTNAKLPRPNDNGIINGQDKSALAIWAKNNAFVFLVGLDNKGNKLDTRHLLCFTRFI